MRLVFAGTPAVALPSLRRLLASERHDVVAVVTRPDRPAGRGRHVASSPVHELATEAGIEVLTPARPSDPAFLARLAEIAPDCCPVVAYGGLVPAAALALPKHGWVNLHFSLLPAWRGAAPVQHAVLAGDEVTGASVFELEAGLDTGPVYGVVTEAVRPRDTSGDLLDRLAESGADLLVAVLDGIADGALTAHPQPADGVSLAPKITVEDARIDWSAPAVGVDRRIRAVTPAPGAWTTFRGKRVKLGPVTPVGPGDPADGVDLGAAEAAGPLAAGRLADLGRAGVLAGTGTGPVRLSEVAPEGRAPMAADAWARGARLTTDDRLG
ncbi:MAG: methionyl-tRNA formyltransferase [Frankia sp.]